MFLSSNLSKLANLWSTNEWKKTTFSKLSLLLLSSSLISVWEKPKKTTNSCGCEPFLLFFSWKLQASRTCTEPSHTLLCSSLWGFQNLITHLQFQPFWSFFTWFFLLNPVCVTYPILVRFACAVYMTSCFFVSMFFFFSDG